MCIITAHAQKMSNFDGKEIVKLQNHQNLRNILGIPLNSSSLTIKQLSVNLFIRQTAFLMLSATNVH